VRKRTVLHAASGIVLFYPGRLLTDQVHDWAQRHGGCRASVSFERSLPGIRSRVRRAALAVIDATEDPAQASDAFLQSVGVLRADSVAVYAEKSHDGLELLVRMLGAPLLLGPMRMDEWDEFLELKFPSLISLDSADSQMCKGKWKSPRRIVPNAENNVVYYRPIAG
jgi:hypothetical protein